MTRSNVEGTLCIRVPPSGRITHLLCMCPQVLNPSETFGNIMVDYSYVECTSACITGLTAFRRAYPDHRAHNIIAALDRAEKFVRSIQRPDGSWWVACLAGLLQCGVR